MFEPPPSRSRRWILPIVIVAVGVAIAGGVLFGGPWYLIVLGVVLVWGYFAVRFLLSDRGKRILFSRFDPKP